MIDHDTMMGIVATEAVEAAGSTPRNCCAFPPLHPGRLSHRLEGGLRRAWEKYLSERPGFDILCGPEVRYSELPTGVDYDANTLTGGYQPFPYGRMTQRDRMIAAEVIQWLGSKQGLCFLAAAFSEAGGEIRYDDYTHNAELCDAAPPAASDNTKTVNGAAFTSANC